jgi:hypothetical protein
MSRRMGGLPESHLTLLGGKYACVCVLLRLSSRREQAILVSCFKIFLFWII